MSALEAHGDSVEFTETDEDGITDAEDFLGIEIPNADCYLKVVLNTDD